MDTPNSQPSRFKKWMNLYLLVVPLLALIPAFFSLWAELTSHSLSARVTSSVALQTVVTSSIPDMVVSVGGRALASPYLSTIVLTNNGAKSIAASDFESPIEFTISKDVEIVRVTVSAINPPDLQGVVITEKQAVKLKPMLLNAGDSLQFAILTAGKAPLFKSRARITGVTKFDLENDTKPKINSQQGVGYLVFFVATLIMIPLCILGIIQPQSVPSVRGLAIGGIVVSLGLSTFTGQHALDFMGIDVDISILAPIVSMLIYGILIYRIPSVFWRR